MNIDKLKNMLQEVRQTEEEKMKMYMRLKKKQLAEMLIACNNTLESLIDEINI